MHIHLNGRMIPATEALVNVDDAGLQHAVGLFETMLVRNGQVFRLDAHLDRLIASSRELGLVAQLDREQLAAAVTQTLEHNQLADARIRLTVTPGPVSLLARSGQGANDGDGNGNGNSPAGPTIAVVATPPTQYDPAYFEQGISTIVIPQAANPFDPTAGHKTLSYWSRLMTLHRAATVKAGEAIWLNITNHVASGAVSNVFMVKDGELLTPIARGEEPEGGLPAPVLPGITRAAIIELAESLGVAIHRKMLSITDLLEADEVFLTNSSWLVLPVTKIEKHEIANGSVGELTRKLREGMVGMAGGVS